MTSCEEGAHFPVLARLSVAVSAVPQPWLVDHSNIQSGRPRRIHDGWVWRVQPAGSHGCLSALALLALLRQPYSLPARPLPFSSLMPIFPSGATDAPNACSRPCAFTFSLASGRFLPRPLASPLTSTSDICLGLLPLSQAVPCIGYPHEIFVSSPAVAVVFGNWHGITPNSPAQRQIPTNPVCSAESRGWC